MTRGAIVCAIVCSMLWGGNSVAIKLAVPVFPPLLMAGMRFAMGCMFVGAWALGQRKRLRLEKHQYRIVVVNGVLLTLQIGLFTVGTDLSTSIHSVILVNVYPFFTALAGLVLLANIPVSPRLLLGMLIAFIGVVTMFGDQLQLPDHRQLEGDVYLVISAAILGFKVTYVKSVLDRISVWQILFWEAVLAVPLFVAVSLLLEGPAAYGFTLPALLAVLYQGWAVSGIAFLLWTLLLARHSPNDVAAFSFTTPLFGTFFGAMILREPFTVFLGMGAVMTVFGIHLIHARSRR